MVEMNGCLLGPFFKENGKVNSNGLLCFYHADTTIPANVRAADGTYLGDHIFLTIDGTTPTQVYLDDMEYTIRMYSLNLNELIGWDDDNPPGSQWQYVTEWKQTGSQTVPKNLTTVIETIAQLQDESVDEGKMVTVTGYLEAGDCPARKYVWNPNCTHASDSGIYIMSNVDNTGKWVCTEDFSSGLPSYVYGDVPSNANAIYSLIVALGVATNELGVPCILDVPGTRHCSLANNTRVNAGSVIVRSGVYYDNGGKTLIIMPKGEYQSEGTASIGEVKVDMRLSDIPSLIPVHHLYLNAIDANNYKYHTLVLDSTTENYENFSDLTIDSIIGNGTIYITTGILNVKRIAREAVVSCQNPLSVAFIGECELSSLDLTAPYTQGYYCDNCIVYSQGGTIDPVNLSNVILKQNGNRSTYFTVIQDGYDRYYFKGLEGSGLVRSNGSFFMTLTLPPKPYVFDWTHLGGDLGKKSALRTLFPSQGLDYDLEGRSIDISMTSEWDTSVDAGVIHIAFHNGTLNPKNISMLHCNLHELTLTGTVLVDYKNGESGYTYIRNCEMDTIVGTDAIEMKGTMAGDLVYIQITGNHYTGSSFIRYDSLLRKSPRKEDRSTITIKDNGEHPMYLGDIHTISTSVTRNFPTTEIVIAQNTLLNNETISLVGGWKKLLFIPTIENKTNFNLYYWGGVTGPFRAWTSFDSNTPCERELNIGPAGAETNDCLAIHVRY